MVKKVDLNKKRNESNNIRNKKQFVHKKQQPQNRQQIPQEHNSTKSNTQNNPKTKDNSLYNTQSNKNKKTSFLDKASDIINDDPSESESNIDNNDIIPKIKLKLPLKVKIIATIIIFIPFITLMLFVSIFADEDSRGESGSGNRNNQGLNGYAYHDGACDKVRVKGGDLISMEEYVAGVIAVEVPGFTDEILKTFAIGARTYVIQGASKVGDDDDCYYDVTNTSASFQAYKSGTVDEQYKNAANDTRGLIVTLDGKPKMYYDASCVYTAAQARSKTPSGTFDDNYVYIRYGEKTISGDNYQKIDKEKVKSIGTLNYYINKAENGTACSGNHGWGMSQNGSAYLEATEGYNYERIINYYYQNKEKLVSIYKGATSAGSYSGNYPIDPNNELYSNNKFLINTSLSNVLSNNGSSVEKFNEHLKSEIEKAGVGTRDASVAAAVTLIGSLAEQGYKINYQWGGIHTELGINSQYGTPVGTGSCDGSYAAQGYDPSVCRTNYKWYGFDCGGFVTWAIYNGMQGSNSPGGVTVSRSNIFSYSANNKISLNSNKAVCKIGGVLDSTGHIVLVVGHDDVNKQYIVAEATGSRINTGYGGVKLSYYPYGKEGYWCGNLDDIYGD